MANEQLESTYQCDWCGEEVPKQNSMCGLCQMEEASLEEYAEQLKEKNNEKDI
jgi:NMD protein affecting ribosome stability and mRNA decay|tara:strand:+ start:68 stop:226 length:159 start_codon:yes stop_codon:yes gene_type:complete